MGNQVTGRYQSASEHWGRYDALPAELKRVYQRAPCDLIVDRHADVLAGLASPAAARRALIELLCAMVVRHARKDYGPDHPAVTHPPRPR